MDFNPDLYRRLQTAYRLLGKTQTSMDQLHMHVTSNIHNMAWNVVYGFAVLTSNSGAYSESDLARRPYADICGLVAQDSLTPCLTALCKSLYRIMMSYKQIHQWHQAEWKREDGGERVKLV